MIFITQTNQTKTDVYNGLYPLSESDLSVNEIPHLEKNYHTGNCDKYVTI